MQPHRTLSAAPHASADHVSLKMWSKLCCFLGQSRRQAADTMLEAFHPVQTLSIHPEAHGVKSSGQWSNLIRAVYFHSQTASAQSWNHAVMVATVSAMSAVLCSLPLPIAPEAPRGRCVIIDNLGAHMTSHTLTLALKNMVDGVLVSLLLLDAPAYRPWTVRSPKGLPDNMYRSACYGGATEKYRGGQSLAKASALKRLTSACCRDRCFSHAWCGNFG